MQRILAFRLSIPIYPPSPACRFSRCCRFHRERVKTGVQFRFQKSVYRPVPVDPAHAGKGCCDDTHPHMCFAISIHARLVAGVLMALVDHIEPFGCEIIAKRSFDTGFDRHV